MIEHDNFVKVINLLTSSSKSTLNSGFRAFFENDFGLSKSTDGGRFPFLKGEVGSFGKLQFSKLSFDIERRTFVHLYI